MKTYLKELPNKIQMGTLLLSTFLVLVVSVCQAADWSSCADDLDRLRRASRDASAAAEEAESARDELENCLNYPDIYDLMQDNCQSLRWDYQSELSDLESELDTVARRIRSVQWSCEVQFSYSSPQKAPQAAGSKSSSQCEMYKSYKGKIPLGSLLDVCKKTMSEEECKKCLGIK